MRNNENQLKATGENLPIVSDEVEVQRNSMRLYVYLVSISTFNGKNKPRIFSHKDFTVNKIKEILHMHPNTIKKYWSLLEQHGLIKYEGPRHLDLTWDKEFMLRKKDGATYYSIPKATPYRIMPRETLNRIQYDYAVSEQELKLYLLLAEMQERFCYMNSCDRVFTIADLRGLLKLSKDRDNNRAIINGLIWLKKLDLIDYTITIEMTNLGTKVSVFELKSVNYYTNGGEAVKYLNTEGQKISEDLKNDLLNNQIVEFFD